MRFLPVVLASPGIALVAACSEPATQPETFSVPVIETRTAAQSHHFQAALSADQEVPPVETQGRGNAIFSLSRDGTALSFKVITTNVENITQAHIHIGARGVNGPVVVFLFGLVPSGVSSTGILSQGTITQANLIARPAIGFGRRCRSS